MSGDATRHGRGRMLLAIGVGAVLVAIGAVGGVVWSERRAANDPSRLMTTVGKSSPAAGNASPAAAAAPAEGSQTAEPVEVTLTPETMERAGITTAKVRREGKTAATSLPATVMSNAYRDTKVVALVGGIVRQVPVELGARVQRAETLAVIISNELAEAQMKYLSARALLAAERQKRERAERLAALGAASRQEVEEATAAHTARETEVAAARQRLLLLGVPSEHVARLREASQVVSEVAVPAPASGVVITRSVNPGQVVNAGQDLFIVADLRTVWVIGDLYEKDFASVRVGSEATVGVPADPKMSLRGRIAYIDPRVDPTTRTAKVRVELPNRGDRLRLGMFVTLQIHTSVTERMLLVPRTAVQALGDRSVVYVPVEGEEGRFVERAVKLGSPVADAVQVLEGLKPGESVVTAGSFFLRAEASRTRPGG